MIGKAWLLDGYHEENGNPETEHIHIVDVVADYGETWGCEYWMRRADGTRLGWILGIPKRYIEFIPQWLLDGMQ